MKTVAIYCSRNTLGGFDENSLKKGVGGSETNAILLAKELGKHDHEVVVFNDVAKEKVFGNVIYAPKHMAGSARADVWIVWRNPEALLDLREKTGRKVLWLHDLMPEESIMPVIHFLDVIWVQSRFHRNQYPNIPDEKFVVQPSGIGFIPVKGPTTRESHLLVYTSDYNRGLDVLLDIWPKYLFAHPHDKLVVAYGTQTQEAIAKQADEARGDTLASKQWQYRWEHLQRRMNLRGVTHVGKLSKKELAELYERASLLAYPSIFPEVQCMSVTESASHGCLPVTTGLAALQETNTTGWQLPPDFKATSNNYLQLLLAARKNISEAQRQHGRELASCYFWEALLPDIEQHILGA